MALPSRIFSSAVRDKPRIHTSPTAKPKLSLKKPKFPAVTRLFQNNRAEDSGDILVGGLWANGTVCIIDVCIGDLDAEL
jgi:hypothetical protein